MAELSCDEAVSVLEPHRDRLWRCGALPYRDYKKTYPNQSVHRASTRAGIVRDLMVDRVRKEFEGVPGTRIIEPENVALTLLEIDERILLRCKKLTADKLTRNYPTTHARDYDRGRDLPEIPPAAQRMTLGYRVNRLQTDIRDVLITYAIGKEVIYSLVLDEPQQGIVVMPPPARGTPNTGASGASRVRIRVSEYQPRLGDL